MLFWSQGSRRTWNGDGHRAWRARLDTSQVDLLPHRPNSGSGCPSGTPGMLLVQDKAPKGAGLGRGREGRLGLVCGWELFHAGHLYKEH